MSKTVYTTARCSAPADKKAAKKAKVFSTTDAFAPKFGANAEFTLGDVDYYTITVDDGNETNTSYHIGFETGHTSGQPMILTGGIFRPKYEFDLNTGRIVNTHTWFGTFIDQIKSFAEKAKDNEDLADKCKALVGKKVKLTAHFFPTQVMGKNGPFNTMAYVYEINLA